MADQGCCPGPHLQDIDALLYPDLGRLELLLQLFVVGEWNSQELHTSLSQAANLSQSRVMVSFLLSPGSTPPARWKCWAGRRQGPYHSPPPATARMCCDLISFLLWALWVPLEEQQLLTFVESHYVPVSCSFYVLPHCPCSNLLRHLDDDSPHFIAGKTEALRDCLFFFFCFLVRHPSCCCWPMPQPQQCQIRAASATYTTAHKNARSLTH